MFTALFGLVCFVAGALAMQFRREIAAYSKAAASVLYERAKDAISAGFKKLRAKIFGA